MAPVYVGVGSNIERERHICFALSALRRRYGKVRSSQVYENDAVGFVGDPFYNLVVEFDTEETPRQVAAALHDIEQQCGRERDKPLFSSRTLDLDLLLYDDVVLEEEGIRLPRADIVHHAFVLAPLAEIAGTRCHPLIGRTYAELWRAFDKTGFTLHPVKLEI